MTQQRLNSLSLMNIEYEILHTVLPRIIAGRLLISRAIFVMNKISFCSYYPEIRSNRVLDNEVALLRQCMFITWSSNTKYLISRAYSALT